MPEHGASGGGAAGGDPGTLRLLSESRRAFRARFGLPPAADAADAGGGPASLPLARRHRVVALLHAAGGAYDAPAWRAAAYGQAVHSTRCAAEAERLFDRLDAVLERPLLFKGPALAAQAWPDPALRAYDDLDLRCGRDEGPALEAALAAAGYVPEIPDARRRSHYWHYGWGTAYRHPAGFRVEANHRFFPPPWPWPKRLEGAAPERCADCRLDARAVRAPAPAFHLLLAAAHALWHGGERLAWIADLAGLMARHPDAARQAEDWAGPRGFARAALHAGLGAAERLFGPGLRPAAAQAGSEGAAERRLLAQLAGGGAVAPADRRALHRALSGPVERWVCAGRRLFTPGDGDFRRLNLPARARPLYRLYRPLRAAFR